MDLRERTTTLALLDYTQARKKPFLHFKTIQRDIKNQEYQILFYADMRIKKYPYQQVPVCYVYDPSEEKNIPEWLLNRVERELLEELIEAGIEIDAHDDFSLYKETVWDGYCKLCGVDFENDGALCDNCSKRKKKDDREKKIAQLKMLYETLQTCDKCGVKITYNPSLRVQFNEYQIGPSEEMIRHHLQYDDPETIVPMCRSCHAKVHLVKDPEYDEYQPVDKPRKIRKTVDMTCSKCSRTIHVKKQNVESGPHYCGECKQKIESLKTQRIRAEKRTVVMGTQSVYGQRVVMAKYETTPRIMTLNVGRDSDYTYWSLVSSLATPVWEKKRDLIKNRIFLTYGCENKYNKAYGCWQTKRDVAQRMRQDIDWYKKHDIEVKLNFNTDSDNDAS